jgi:S1-C subfamily serine protease
MQRHDHDDSEGPVPDPRQGAEGTASESGDFEEELVDPSEPQRGWVPTDDRLWRHPSEIPGGSPPERVRGARAPGVSDRSLRRTLLTSGVITVVVITTATLGTLVFTRASVTHPITLAVTTTVDPRAATIPAAPAVLEISHSVLPSMVALVVTRRNGPVVVTGVALHAGDLVMTSADGLLGAERVEAVTMRGHHEAAWLVGVDTRSGVAVVRVAADLPSAPLSDESMDNGELAVAVCLGGDGRELLEAGHQPTSRTVVGMVRETGTPPSSGGPALIESIEADAPMQTTHGGWGGVLLDSTGEVTGILDRQETDDDGTLGVFVPARLAQGVAEQLATGGHIDHGWLGIQGVTAAAGGVEILAVYPGSPAATAGIRPGDVLSTLDGTPVDSLPDLQAALYVLPPGSPIVLGVDDDGHPAALTATLATAG